MHVVSRSYEHGLLRKMNKAIRRLDRGEGGSGIYRGGKRIGKRADGELGRNYGL